MEFRINLENNVGFHLIKKHILRFFWIQFEGPALILSLPNMKLDTVGYFTDEKGPARKKRYREMLSCAGKDAHGLEGLVHRPDSFLGISAYILPLLKSTSTPGPWVRIDEMKYPLTMKCES